MELLILDNYDSFTFNLVHYCEGLGAKVTVARNDEINLEEVNRFDKIILSPGPHLPKDAGIMMELINHYYLSKPILGVCLGLQALGEFFGGVLYNLEKVKHGVQEKCTRIGESKLLHEVSSCYTVGLYHSWALKQPLPKELKLTSVSEEGVVMSFEHETLPISGVQYHPESIMTEEGKRILTNFLNQ
ncbi:MAG: anthranilate synthase component II [Lishizhenia sp.]